MGDAIVAPPSLGGAAQGNGDRAERHCATPTPFWGWGGAAQMNPVVKAMR